MKAKTRGKTPEDQPKTDPNKGMIDAITGTMASADAQKFLSLLTPKSPGDNLLMYHCPKCSKCHFRHAGYIKTMLPYLVPGSPGGDGHRIIPETHQVLICIGCKTPYVWVGSQVYDMTDKIDLDSWEKFEKEADKHTGPGGEC